MAFSVVGSASAINNGGNTVGPICPTVAVDDLLLLAVTVASGSRTVTWPTGFVELANPPTVSGYMTRVAHKMAVGTEGSTALTATVSGGALKITGVMVAIRGVDPTNPVDGATPTASGTVSASKVLASYTTLTGGCMELTVVGNARGPSTPNIAEYTAELDLAREVQDFTSAEGSSCSSAIALRTAAVPVGTVLGPRTWTYDQSASGGGYVMALRPGVPSPATAQFYNGTAWVESGPIQRYDGTQWVSVPAT